MQASPVAVTRNAFVKIDMGQDLWIGFKTTFFVNFIRHIPSLHLPMIAYVFCSAPRRLTFRSTTAVKNKTKYHGWRCSSTRCWQWIWYVQSRICWRWCSTCSLPFYRRTTKTSGKYMKLCFATRTAADVSLDNEQLKQLKGYLLYLI